MERGFRYIGGENHLAEQNLLEGCVSCETAFFSRDVLGLTIRDHALDGYVTPLDLGGAVLVQRLLSGAGSSLFSLAGGAVIDSVFHAVEMRGNASIYRNNTFASAVAMVEAFGNVVTANVFGGDVFGLADSTRENLLFANVFNDTAVSDAGNNTWCVNDTGNDYVAGASYTPYLTVSKK